MKVYAGAPAAARCYVEADRGRADDYYLTEGTGVARRFTATDGRVRELAPLTGEAYETWVAGRDPATGEPRGRLRSDAHAVRFVEVVVNGPKTWSLAAALHPDIAAAYEAAQDRAAEQIVAWLSEHATTRVGPAGGQVQVPVEVLEAATVRHFTSRANDPHWHLHLQFLSRVYAAAKWRGLHTVGIRDFLGAINGIGHAAMDTDPELNAAFAANGYTKDPTGEIPQLAKYVGPFSARHAQIARNVDRYEREWAAAHPDETPGPALRHAWDARAWAEGRPDKVSPQPRADVGERWRTDLAELGFRAPTSPVPLSPTPVGALDRDELVGRALTRLAAARSAWNAADVRGEVERLIAAEGVVVDAGVRIELAEDLTARAMRMCVPLLQRDGVAEHIRAWTSRPVLAVEADLTARLAAPRRRALNGRT
nr:MobF family relaxase [Blastococcus sp. TML/C7B]